MDWTALLTQIPLVAAFMWYALEQQRRGQEVTITFMAALDKRDQEYERRNAAIIAALNELSRNIAMLTERTCSHDEVTREAIQRMDGKTSGPTPRRRSTD
jgi:hypothetical protein